MLFRSWRYWVLSHGHNIVFLPSRAGFWLNRVKLYVFGFYSLAEIENVLSIWAVVRLPVYVGFWDVKAGWSQFYVQVTVSGPILIISTTQRAMEASSSDNGRCPVNILKLIFTLLVISNISQDSGSVLGCGDDIGWLTIVRWVFPVLHEKPDFIDMRPHGIHDSVFKGDLVHRRVRRILLYDF